MATYTYNPLGIEDGGSDQMRFELGDVDVSAEALSAALCDEEYQAIIKSASSWKIAKLKCLKAIMLRFAHQVNMSADGLSYSFQARYEAWKKLYEEEKKKVPIAPTVDKASLATRENGGYYFYTDMMHNPDYKGGEQNV